MSTCHKAALGDGQAVSELTVMRLQKTAASWGLYPKSKTVISQQQQLVQSQAWLRYTASNSDTLLPTQKWALPPLSLGCLHHSSQSLRPYCVEAVKKKSLKKKKTISENTVCSGKRLLKEKNTWQGGTYLRFLFYSMPGFNESTTILQMPSPKCRSCIFQNIKDMQHTITL